MENRQGRKGKDKAAAAAADPRQIDLWVGPEKAGNGVPKHPKTVVQLPAAPAKALAKRALGAKPHGAVKVTVSKPSRGATAIPDRSLPALTRRQHELLDYLRRRSMQPGPPPSLSEICRDVGLASRGSLHKQVVALVHAGLVEPMQGKQRGVRLVAAAANDSAEVPLLGAIAAGRPIEALGRDESVSLPDWLRGGNCYALRVRGDSMRDVGILDGDVVVVEPRDHARNGETVVALIDGESATLKRIEQRPDGVLLHAENPAYEPQRYAAERVQIQGVVIAQLRRY